MSCSLFLACSAASCINEELVAGLAAGNLNSDYNGLNKGRHVIGCQMFGGKLHNVGDVMM